MASPILAQLVLCDAALADSAGKISMLGAGWSATFSPTAPQAVAVLVRVPWDRTNQRLSLKLELVGADGGPIELLDVTGEAQRVGAEGEVEAGRPPGIAHGSYINAPFTLSVPSMPLPPGRYEWRLDVAGEPVATQDFTVLESSPRP